MRSNTTLGDLREIAKKNPNQSIAVVKLGDPVGIGDPEENWETLYSTTLEAIFKGNETPGFHSGYYSGDHALQFDHNGQTLCLVIAEIPRNPVLAH